MSYGASTYQTTGLRYSTVLSSAVNELFDPTMDRGPNHYHFPSFHDLRDVLQARSENFSMRVQFTHLSSTGQLPDIYVAGKLRILLAPEISLLSAQGSSESLTPQLTILSPKTRMFLTPSVCSRGNQIFLGVGMSTLSPCPITRTRALHPHRLKSYA